MLEEIVTRDGTDYGATEKPVSVRLEEAMNSLREGRALLAWDEESESASLVDRSQVSG